MNMLDRAIAVVSPAAGLRRAQNRAALDMVQRNYDGGGRGRHTQGWATRATSGNAEVGGALGLLRDRSRDLIRNNAYAARMHEVWVSNMVGGGIQPRAKDKDAELFKAWADECDADGRHDFYGLQALVASAEWESGECLIRFRPRRVADGLTVPLQLQVLEPDHLDTGKTSDIADGGVIIQGVEFDAVGQRVAYWLFPTHPGDALPFSRRSFVSKRIPASEILHIYRQRRAGQVRGVPALSPVLLRLRDLDVYEGAELLRKQIEACFAVFVRQPAPPNTAPLTANKAGADGKLVEDIVPGTIKYLQPGQEVDFGGPAISSDTGFTRQQLHAISAGSGVTYQQATGDMSQANYSSMRGGLLEFRRGLSRHQKQVMIYQMCRPIWRRFSQAARIMGKQTAQAADQWIPPRFEAVDPLKDAMADVMLIRGGLKTLFEGIAEHGGDTVQWAQEMKNIIKVLDDTGLVLDTDPRKVAKTGAFQPDTKLTKED